MAMSVSHPPLHLLLGDCDVSYNGRGPVLSVFQWRPRPLPGGSAAPHPDFLHQAASARLPARCPRLSLPDSPGEGCVWLLPRSALPCT